MRQIKPEQLQAAQMRQLSYCADNARAVTDAAVVELQGQVFEASEAAEAGVELRQNE